MQNTGNAKYEKGKVGVMACNEQNLKPQLRCGEHIGREVKRLDNEIHSMMAVARTQTGNADMTMMHNWVIGYLYRNQGKEIFQRDVEAEFSIARSTATGILQLMEKKGYLYRESVERDARLKRLVLTENGIRCHEEHIQTIIRIEYMMREGFSEQEIENFFRVIRKMRENLEKNHSETDRRRE